MTTEVQNLTTNLVPCHLLILHPENSSHSLKKKPLILKHNYKTAKTKKHLEKVRDKSTLNETAFLFTCYFKLSKSKIFLPLII